MSGTTHHYKSNLRDLYFNLFEVLDVGTTSLGHGPYASMDEPAARDALKGLEALAVGELATGFAETDRIPLKIEQPANTVSGEI